MRAKGERGVMYLGSSSSVMIQPQPTPLMYPGGTAGTAYSPPNCAQVVEIDPVRLLVCILTSLAPSYTACSASICSFFGPSLAATDDYRYPFRLILDNTPPIEAFPLSHTLQCIWYYSLHSVTVLR